MNWSNHKNAYCMQLYYVANMQQSTTIVFRISEESPEPQSLVALISDESVVT